MGMGYTYTQMHPGSGMSLPYIHTYACIYCALQVILSAPLVVSLLIMGALSATAACATTFLEETLGRPLKDKMHA